jgi:hypothetical protein
MGWQPVHKLGEDIFERQGVILQKNHYKHGRVEGLSSPDQGCGALPKHGHDKKMMQVWFIR